jgi:hypothetical protein
VLLVAAVAAALVFVGYRAYQNRQIKPSSTGTTTQSTVQKRADEKKQDSNEGYLVIKEWGLRFKVPVGLSDVRYSLDGDTAGFFAKPTGYQVDYRSNYTKVNGSSGESFPYALGILIRSKDSTKDKLGDQLEGRKLGEYYYYTSHSFASLASGAGATGIFFDVACDKDSTLAKCDVMVKAEQKAFGLINNDGGLLRSIELAK